MKNVVKLGDVCKIVTGSTPKSNVQEFWNGNLKWLTPAELDENSFIVYDTERKITFDGAKATGLKPFPAGTVILSSRAPIGKVAVSGCEMYCNQGFKNLICGSRIHNIYLYWFLKSKTEFLNSLGRGATFKEISKPIVENIDIPLPSYSQQESIAEQFNEIQKLIVLYMEQHALLEILVKSRFIEMFGNPVVNPKGLKKVLLADLSELITKGASPNWQGFVYTDDNTQTLFVTSENVREGFLDLTTPKYIEDGFNEKQKRSLLRKGDFLINIVGASIGRAAQYNFLNKANINQAVALVRVKPNTIRDNYLLYYLNSEKAQRMYNAMKSDTGRANLSLQDIANLEILLPSIGEQDEFDLFMQQVDKSKFDGSNLKFIHLNWLKEKFCRNILA